MKTLKVKLNNNRAYPIIIGSGLLSQKEEIKEYTQNYSKIMIISNDKIFGLYGRQAQSLLKKGDSPPASLGTVPFFSIIPDGEKYKNIPTVEKIYTDCINNALDRKSLIVALGGGVIGDIAGFVSATYMRGIDFIQVPTTLLAQVDSSVGGKTGVNHPCCKNMIGAFYQPSLVYIDIDTLKTLEKRELLSGIAEVIKYGAILSEKFYKYIENNVDEILNLNPKVLEEIIYQSCKFKAEIVSKDEKESGLRAILNYGHTIGHAIESASNYERFTHGEAISMGMIYASKIAVNKGMLKKSELERQISLLKKFGLPISVDIDSKNILDMIKSDKKFISGEPKFVLLEAIGRCKYSVSVSFEDIKAILYN